MPGLIGLFKQTDGEGVGALLADMAQQLEPEARFRRELHHEAEFGFGRVSLGIVNAAAQPAWNDGRSLGLVMDGELYDFEAQRQALGGSANASQAEFLLNRYLEYGDDFAAPLNGAFSAVIWDRRARKLLLISDRLGLHPLYYAHLPNGFVFGAGVRAVLADPDVPRDVDRVAIAQFLTFDHVLGQRTFMRAVQLLPQGSVLTYHQGQVRLKRYYALRYPERYPHRSQGEFREELLHHLRRAVRRQIHTPAPAGLMLSGGLDSRLLLGLMAEASNGQPVTTFTWGIPGADDVRYAAECARVAGARHYFFELKPSWLLDKAERVVGQSDGMGNVVNLHAAAALEAEAQHAQIIFKGFMGDAMFGFGLRPRHWADYADEDRLCTHLEAYRDYDVLDFDLPEHPRLFTPAFQQAIGDEALGAYEAAIRESGVTQLAVQRLYIDLTNRVPRMTLNGVEMVRPRAVVRLPFADNDLVEFSLRIPPGFHYGRELVKQAFLQAFPAFAQVPVTPTNLPQTACAREVALRAASLVRWHLRRVGLGRLAGPEQRPYKDYNLWFRTELRAWVTDVLLSQRCLERGYFSAEYVRQLVQAHMSGDDHAVRLGALLSVELWHRQFVDGVRTGSRRAARELSPA
ncbi:MAG: hypothetical protein IT318_09645 [Anaerolineales bacterium]|nr:hypothetical protein [Anaerolineales bacterium]